MMVMNCITIVWFRLQRRGLTVQEVAVIQQEGNGALHDDEIEVLNTSGTRELGQGTRIGGYADDIHVATRSGEEVRSLEKSDS